MLMCKKKEPIHREEEEDTNGRIKEAALLPYRMRMRYTVEHAVHFVSSIRQQGHSLSLPTKRNAFSRRLTRKRSQKDSLSSLTLHRWTGCGPERLLRWSRRAFERKNLHLPPSGVL